MSEINTYDYRSSEYYDLPQDDTQQLEEELRVFDSRQELRDFVKWRYGRTPVAHKLRRYTKHVVKLPLNGDADPFAPRGNVAFYDGAMLAVHINYVTSGTSARTSVLRAGHLPDIDESSQGEVELLRLLLDGWAGADNASNWITHFENQDLAFQVAAVEMVKRLYAGEDNAEERMKNFMMGFMFGSTNAWVSVMENNSRLPRV